MISKWILVIRHLNGEDVIHNIENDTAKERLLHFFTGKTSLNVKKYAARLKDNPKVVLVASNHKRDNATQ